MTTAEPQYIATATYFNSINNEGGDWKAKGIAAFCSEGPRTKSKVVEQIVERLKDGSFFNPWEKKETVLFKERYATSYIDELVRIGWIQVDTGAEGHAQA